MLLGVRIYATHRFFEKVKTANNDKLAFRAAQGYVHPAAIPQKSEGPNSRSAIVPYKRDDHHIRFAALERIDRTDKIEIRPHWRKSIQVRERLAAKGGYLVLKLVDLGFVR
jgi:hypothetical protein